MADWTFPKQHPLDKHRDPVLGEFFSTDSISTIADALVRESVQNALDARVDSDRPVQIRIYLSGEENALQPENARMLFGSLAAHVQACEEKTRELFSRPCRFIVIEDFNTTGLRGNPQRMYEPSEDEQEKEEFYYFFRAEGRSSKTGADRGNWGVGKYTFPASSNINTFFGLTVRTADTNGEVGPIAFGQSVLRNHSVGESHFKPDGWWCRFIDVDGYPSPVPFGGTDTEIEMIRHAFSISRTSEPGLSVAVPYIDEDLTTLELRAAILRNYAVAMAQGLVEFTVQTPDGTWEYRQENIEREIRKLGEGVEEVLDDVSAARWAESAEDSDWIVLGRIGNGAPSMSDAVVSDEAAALIREKVQLEQPFGVKLPIAVGKQGDDSVPLRWPHLEIVYLPNEKASKPHFYREGLRINEVKSDVVPGLKAVVTAREKPLTRLLGDSEGPAHVDWSSRTERFRGKYHRGRAWVSFVKRSPAAVMSLARRQDEDEDVQLVRGFFPKPLAVPNAPSTSKRGKRGKGGETTDPTPPNTDRARASVYQVGDNGFRVTASGDALESRVMAISCAYDIRKGNPIKKWSPHDFELSDDMLDLVGAALETVDGNKIVVRISDPEEFSVTVSGFDVHRDLKVETRFEKE